MVNTDELLVGKTRGKRSSKNPTGSGDLCLARGPESNGPTTFSVASRVPGAKDCIRSLNGP